MNNKPNSPPRKPWLSIFRLLRAVAIGVGVFALLSFLPTLLLMLNGINLNPQQAELDDEPVHYDVSGKRVNQADRDLQMGRDQAQEMGITSHAACKATFKVGLKARGCHRYVTEQKHIPHLVRQGNWIGGKTTEQCLAEVDAYWGPVVQDEREQGDDHAASSWTRRNWLPEREECQNYDNVRIGKVVYEPTARLERLLQLLAQGGRVTEQDKTVVRQDMLLVSTFPDHAAKRAYFDKVDQFFQRADGP